MGRTANDSEVSRLGNWVDDVLLLNVGNAGEEGGLLFFFFFWLQHGACGILVTQSGIEPMSPALEGQSLNPWTAREIPKGFWSEQSKFSTGRIRHRKFSIALIRMLFIHFLNTKYKRIPFLSWVPYLKQKEKAIKDNLSQAL